MLNGPYPPVSFCHPYWLGICRGKVDAFSHKDKYLDTMTQSPFMILGPKNFFSRARQRDWMEILISALCHLFSRVASMRLDQRTQAGPHFRLKGQHQVEGNTR